MQHQGVSYTKVIGIGKNNTWDENIGETDEGDGIKPIIEQK